MNCFRDLIILLDKILQKRLFQFSGMIFDVQPENVLVQLAYIHNLFNIFIKYRAVHICRYCNVNAQPCWALYNQFL